MSTGRMNLPTREELARFERRRHYAIGLLALMNGTLAAELAEAGRVRGGSFSRRMRWFRLQAAMSYRAFPPLTVLS